MEGSEGTFAPDDQKEPYFRKIYEKRKKERKKVKERITNENRIKRNEEEQKKENR